MLIRYLWLAKTKPFPASSFVCATYADNGGKIRFVSWKTIFRSCHVGVSLEKFLFSTSLIYRIQFRILCFMSLHLDGAMHSKRQSLCMMEHESNLPVR